MEEGKRITSYGQHFKSLPRISATPVIKVTSLNYLAQDYACVAEFAEYWNGQKCSVTLHVIETENMILSLDGCFCVKFIIVC